LPGKRGADHGKKRAAARFFARARSPVSRNLLPASCIRNQLVGFPSYRKIQ
jgi:hypothetical protein